jgi:transglutaminase-like putative cysteine protease
MKMKPFLTTLAICLAAILFQTASAQDNWRPISQEDLQSKTPLIEPDADAEVLFWEVRVEDKYVPRAGYSTILNHYIRIKIFTELGREENSKVDIRYGRSKILGTEVNISEISARTIKKDGSVVVLDEKDIFERQIVSTGDGTKYDAKSFVPPGIETGAIIEYRWKEIRRKSLSFNLRLQIARQFPVRQVKYYLKPVSAPRFTLAMRIQSFNTRTNLQQEDNGFYSMTFPNIPAFKEEPFMPPEYDVRPWLLIYYADEDDDTGLLKEEYWRNDGKYNYEVHKSILKKKKNIAKAATEAIGDATDTLEKVRRIFDYCRANIRNVNDDALDLSPDELKKIKENDSEEQTLKRGQGTPHDIDSLFAAMLNAAEIDARFADSTARVNPRFDDNLLNGYLLQYESIAVNVDGEWIFLKPSLQHLPFGMLDWAREGQRILISDKKQPIWKETPISGSDKSRRTTRADLSIDSEGLLTGTMTIELTGHLAARYKENLDEEPESKREDAVVDYVRALVSSSAELKNIKIENLGEPEKPLIYSFEITVPGYAVPTGKRLFLSPGVPSHARTPVFRSNSRKNDVFITYAWSERDEILIRIPDGFNAEITDPPATITDTRAIGMYSAKISFNKETRKIRYLREFSFGKPGALEFGVDSYPRLKSLFDSYHAADQHAIALIKDDSTN